MRKRCRRRPTVVPLVQVRQPCKPTEHGENVYVALLNNHKNTLAKQTVELYLLEWQMHAPSTTSALTNLDLRQIFCTDPSFCTISAERPNKLSHIACCPRTTTKTMMGARIGSTWALNVMLETERDNTDTLPGLTEKPPHWCDNAPH